MKPQVKNVNANRWTRSSVRPEAQVRTIQPQGAKGQPCRTTACTSAHAHGQSAAAGQAARSLNQARGVPSAASANSVNRQAIARPTSSLGPRAPNYNVQTPVPLGHGSQQIRATIQGTPQVAGSVEISRAGSGTAYISNLKVDQQHRRRGVAAKLIDAAISAARRQGFRAASLEARPSDNGISSQALVSMYRRQGFKSVGKSARGSPLMERKL